MASCVAPENAVRRQFCHRDRRAQFLNCTAPLVPPQMLHCMRRIASPPRSGLYRATHAEASLAQACSIAAVSFVSVLSTRTAGLQEFDEPW